MIVKTRVFWLEALEVHKHLPASGESLVLLHVWRESGGHTEEKRGRAPVRAKKSLVFQRPYPLD